MSFFDLLKFYAVLVPVVAGISWLFAHFIAIMRGQDGLYGGDFATSYIVVTFLVSVFLGLTSGSFMSALGVFFVLLGVGGLVYGLIAHALKY